MEEGLCIIQDKVRVVKRSMKRVFRRVSHLGFSHGLVVVLIFTGNFLEEELLFSCFTDIDTLHVHVYSSTFTLKLVEFRDAYGIYPSVLALHLHWAAICLNPKTKLLHNKWFTCCSILVAIAIPFQVALMSHN